MVEEEEDNSALGELKDKIEILLTVKQIRINFLVWSLCIMNATLAYFVVALSLNTLVGDLYVNNIGSASLELIA